MPTFDKVKDFFIRRILLANIFKIDIPGYLITASYSIEGVKVAMRTIMIPDRFLINLEDIVEKKIGPKGIREIYAAGKGDGYYVAKITNFPKDEKVYSTLVPSFFGTLYAKEIGLKIEKDNQKVLAIDLDVIGPAGSRKDRYSYWILGAWAGFFSCMLNNEKIECAVRSVENEKFYLVNAEVDYLKSNKIGQVFESTILGKLNILQYYANNKLPVNLPGNGATIKKLMDEQILTYESGRMFLNKDMCRYIPFESFGLLQLEKSLSEDIISEASYKYFFELGSSYGELKDPYLFLSRLLTALGFGIVEVIKINDKKSEVIFKGYPWFSGDLSTTRVPFVRGAFSGFLSAILKRDINASFVSSKLVSGIFTLSLALES